MDSFLTVQNLSKSFGKLKAVDCVSMEVQDNSITLIFGPNGSGKTTLLNLISGIYESDDGKITFQGRELIDKPVFEIYRMGIVRAFQIPKPLKRMNVLENLMIADFDHPGESPLTALKKSEWLEKERELVDRAFRILSFLQLDHLWDSEAFKLSGGQLKLLEIGRALMTRPKLILMDEPVGGLHPHLAHQIFERLTQLREQNQLTFLIVEHRLEIALGYVDRALFMVDGKIQLEGDPNQLVSNPSVVQKYMGG